MPGVIMAMARLNRPSLMIYGGSIRPGKSALDGRPLNVGEAFQSYGQSSVDLKASTHHVWDMLQSDCQPAPQLVL